MDNNGWIVSAYLVGVILSGWVAYMYGTRVLGWELVRNKSEEGTMYWIAAFWPVMLPLAVLIEVYSLVKHKRDDARGKGR